MHAARIFSAIAIAIAIAIGLAAAGPIHAQDKAKDMARL
jgi:hypothetical protein